ncbi:MAG: glycosyltransferase family 2 protein [Bacteroidales bacterium]|nr:glycosyltransferase family 2 protein [Bacteroidales bacterium]
MKKVLVIVVTYNGMRWLECCLSSVMPGTTGDLQTDLYVLDNDSTDGSADFVQAHFPKAKVVRSAENLGFSKANNLGFRYALDKGYDYVYLLNQDAWLEEGALETLVAAAEEDSQYGVLSPVQMTDGFKELDRLFKKDKTPPAAHWLVPVGALQKVGLFEEDLFPLYGQDDDWCNRASYHGWKIGVIPEARGVHDRAQRAEAKEKIIHRNYYSGSLVRLCDINRPLWERFCYVCLFTLVKAFKYRSALVFKYFYQICQQLPAVRKHRAQSR